MNRETGLRLLLARINQRSVQSVERDAFKVILACHRICRLCRPPNVGRDVCSATICPPYTESRISNGAQLYARSPFRCNAHD